MRYNTRFLKSAAYIFVVAMLVLPFALRAALPAFSIDTYGVGPGPQTVASGDLNSDTFPDLLTADLINGTLSILFNNGDGTYHEPFTPLAVGPTRDAKIADMTGDGIPDVVAVTENVGGAVLVHPGLGNGTFFSAIETSLSQQGLFSLTIEDFNHDGDQDVVVAMQDVDQVKVLLGNGDGTFASIDSYDLPGGPNFVQHAEVNGDNDLDILVGYSATSSISVLLGSGDGTFLPELVFPTGMTGNASPIQLGDLDHDGDQDVVVGVNGMTLVMQNTGEFALGVFAARGAPVGLADIDSDGNLDLVVTSPMLNALRVLLGSGDATFSALVQFPAGVSASPIGTISDLNGDGKPDVAVANFSQDLITVFLNVTDKTTLHPSD